VPIIDSDPRVFFAAERTLLAWLRTGLTLMALGFVIARFGLFLRLVASQAPHPSPQHGSTVSAVLGVAFVLFGSLAILGSTVQHQRFIATLPRQDLPPRYSRSFALVLCFFVAALGIALGVYLALSST
jgi:putative membrane protein